MRGTRPDCRVCGSHLPPPRAADQRFGYRRCPRCGLGVIDPWPTSATAESYDRGYFVGGGHRSGYADYEADARWHRRTAKRRLDRVEAGLGVPRQQTRRLLDVGAAVGYVLDEAASRGWDATGLDRSEWASDRARGRGHRMVASFDELLDEQPTWDAVTFFQVLEHIEDPGDALVRAARLLRPGGVVVCETWDAASRTARLAGARWQQLSPPSVLWLFTPDSTRRLLATAGLETVSWRRSPKVVGAGTVLAQSLRVRPGAPSQLAADALGRLGLPYFFDDLVTFVARRPD